MGFCMALKMNSVGFSGEFMATPGFFWESQGLGWFLSGDLEPRKAGNSY